MRTPAEIAFRTRQELANVRLWLRPPRTAVQPPSPLPHLPSPKSIADRLRETVFACELVRLADSIREHRFPVSDRLLIAGDQIEWRRDHETRVMSGTRYFRTIPYLDPTQAGDSRMIWELNRHQHLVVLAQASLFTRSSEYIDEIESQLISWLLDNPYMRGINWTSALEVGFRALSWLWVLHLVGERLTPEARQALISGLHLHGCYLECNLSVYASPNTHLLGEAVALHALGLLIPAFNRSGIWRKLGREVVARQMNTQVHEDGSHFEQSSYYHLYALDLFAFHHVLEPASQAYRDKLRKMADYLDALTGCARALPLIGDDDGGRLFHPYGPCERFGRASLATCAKLLGGPWPYADEDLHEQAVWWVGPEASDSNTGGGRQVVRNARLFENAGLAAMHAHELDVLVDVGPFGGGRAGHSHSDTLSLLVRCGSEETLVDNGTYTYIADANAREWFRSSAAHNTVRIDQHDQAIPQGPFRWEGKPIVEVSRWKSDATSDELAAVCHYGSVPHFTHRRQLLLLRGGGWGPGAVLVIRDVIDGNAGLHLVEQFWHPGERVEFKSPRCVRIGAKATLLTIQEVESVDAWRSRRFGTRVPAKSLAIRDRVLLPHVMWTAIAVGALDDEAELVAGADACHAVLKLAANIALELSATSGVLMLAPPGSDITMGNPPSEM